MDGASTRRVARAAALAALVALAWVHGAHADDYRVEGSCRDGRPQGAWRLIGPEGTPRALGAFSKGRRTGSFIFWNDAGVRIAHIPYDDEGIRNGTLALWYDEDSRIGSAPQRLEAKYVRGKRDGIAITWYRDGRMRGEYRYVNGKLVEATARDERGRLLDAERARAQAEADRRANEREYAELEALVDAHLPRCR